MSYRSKLQAAFLLLGLTAIALTGWEASDGATRALEQATYDRLTAIREHRAGQMERWFADLGNHVLALAADDSTVSAIQMFGKAWSSLPPLSRPQDEALDAYYRDTVERATPDGRAMIPAWLPRDPRARTLQSLFLAGNPHPVGQKDRLLNVPGPYGQPHAQYHPTLHRYQKAFGFYDVFLIDAAGLVLYTVFKEIDLGVPLAQPPYRDSPLGRLYARAIRLERPEEYVTSDYASYLPSHLAPAAFLATPVWRAGQKLGVLAIQVSADEVKRVMTNDGRREEGFGQSGQAYLVGPDGLLRSEYSATPVLGRPARPAVKVLRSESPLRIPGLAWCVVAEIDEQEALSPVRRLRLRILGIGAFIAAVFLAAAAWLARSVTRPVAELAQGADRLGRLDFGVRLPVRSKDELGDLAASFNRMADELERTTVSKGELEKLAGRLITAQEDERRRLAAELHDDLSQRLAAIAIEAGLLEKGGDPARLQTAAGRIKDQMARVSTDVHGLARRLHPSILDDLGLAVAIEAEGRALFERGGPAVDFAIEGDEGERLPPAVELALFRVVQEALRNAEKHANANEVRIRLERGATAVHLSLQDDGCGFDRGHPSWRAGIGLASMEERARSLGGRLHVNSRSGDGTTIEVWLPLAPSNP